MKAISLWQPWASAVALGVKRNETRHWPTSHRGLIAIHGARKDTRELRAYFALLLSTSRHLKETFDAAGLFSFTMLPKGAIVAIAELVAVWPTESVNHRSVGDLEGRLGDYSVGRFVWVFKNIQPLPQPYFLTGRQGLFNAPCERILMGA